MLTPELRSIPGYEGLYSASSDGRIWSHTKKCWRKEHVDPFGYHRVSLKVNRASKTFRVHRLVALAWLGAPVKGRTQVNHISGVKSDNRPSNLEWVSALQNIRHAIHLGLLVPSRTRLKEIGIATRKLSVEDATTIRSRYASGELQKHLAVEFGVSKTTIRNILNGTRYQA